jgi:hypothetical protein
MPITQDYGRWLYHRGHPNPVARALNRFSAVVYGAGMEVAARIPVFRITPLS